jgi:hypothetical protein
MTTLTTIYSVPEVVIRYIFDFLGCGNDANNLLESSNKLFMFCTRDYHFWKLTKNQSKWYYVSEDYRKKIVGLLRDPAKQLAINLMYCSKVRDVAVLQGVHTLDLSGCKNITNLASISGVNTLSLYDCTHLTSIDGLTNVKHINLQYCRFINDISTLRTAESVNLSYCYAVTDITVLANVKNVNLSFCWNVRDISALSKYGAYAGGCALTNRDNMLDSHLY